jgi:hypothetical protein
MKKTDISSSIKLTPENNLTPAMNQQTPLDSKFNATNITSPESSSSSSPSTDKLTATILNPSSPISKDKWQESIVNRFDSPFNEFQQEKFQEEISKTVSLIMKQAAHIVHDDGQPQINATDSSSILTPLIEAKHHNDTVQSVLLPSKQDDEQRNSPWKCIPLAERLAQAKAKKLATLLEPTNKDHRSLQLLEQQSPMQKKFLPFTSDPLKQSSTNTSSPNQINQFQNDLSSMKQNPNENLKTAQVQQESNNISSVTYPIDKTINNPISTSNIDKAITNNQRPNAENQPIKPSLITDKQINNDYLQQEQPTGTSKLTTPVNVSSTTDVSAQNRLPNFHSSSLTASHQNDSLTKLGIQITKKPFS